MQIKKEEYNQIKNKLQDVTNDIDYNIQKNTREINYIAHNQKVMKKERTQLYELMKVLNNKDEKLQTFIEKEVCILITSKLQALINHINFDIQKNKTEINSLDYKQKEMKKERTKLYELMRMLK